MANAQLDPMRRQLQAWGSPEMLKKETFQPQAPTGPIKEFEGIRQGVSNRANAAKQGTLDAMKRRFAAAGGLNSGAAIKAQQVATQQADQNTADQMAQVDFQEANERQRRVEQDQARQEAVAGRNLQRESQNANMSFQDKISKFDAGSKLAQLDLSFDQFALAKDESEFNKKLERYKAGRSGGLFGGGGFLGLGIGAKDADI